MAPTEVPTVVCDAGPLIHLDELDCSDLLGSFHRVLVPEAVWQEVERHRPQAVNKGKSWERCTVSLADVEPLVPLLSAWSLDLGEAAALGLLLRHKEAVLLTDDTAARNAAKALGLRVHGTLGVLIRSIRLGQRSREQVLERLTALPEVSTLHVKPLLLDQVRQRVLEAA